MTLRSLIFLLLIDTCCSAATVKMSIGWDGAYRVGRWTPVFVTASDSAPRSVIFELYVSHDQKDGVRIRQNATISQAETTFVLFAPIGVSRDDLSLTIRDAKTQQRIATTTSRDSFTSLRPLPADAVSQLVVISGTPDTSPALQMQLNDTGVIVSRWVDPIRLPSVALGYDAMNLLILSNPDLNKIAADQQDAILDWVRGGGHLLCWIGPEALPAASSILEALPATVGSNSAVTISSHVLSARGLTPAANAKQIPLLDGRISALQRRFGFGTITLLPIDPAALSFENAAAWLAFWSPLLDGAVSPHSRVPQEQAADRYVDAVMETRQALGETDPSSQFDFGQVWFILLLAAGIVGPLDWIVLRMLGRRPWTFSTSAGWIGFLLLCGVGVVRATVLPQSDPRSITLIDQADSITVATLRAMNSFDATDQKWCEPFAADKTILQRTSVRFDLDLHEDQHGVQTVPSANNRLIPQMLLSQSIEPTTPAISAELRLASKDGKPTISGKITNLTKSSLDTPTIHTKDGACTIQSIPSGATVSIDAVLSPGPTQSARIWNLAVNRTLTIEELLTRDDHLACFESASAVGSPSATYVRALITLAP